MELILPYIDVLKKDEDVFKLEKPPEFVDLTNEESLKHSIQLIIAYNSDQNVGLEKLKELENTVQDLVNKAKGNIRSMIHVKNFKD